MIYKQGTKLTDRETGDVFIVSSSTPEFTAYAGAKGKGSIQTSEVAAVFEIDDGGAPPALEGMTADQALSVLDIQEGGDHYKKLGQYQPWEVLRAWLTPEEFRGYMKGTAIAYLARERDKGGTLDIRKATHTLQGLVELAGEGA